MADTITYAKDIYEYLETSGIGTGGSDLFYHNSPEGTGFQISVMDTGGFDPNLYLNPDDAIRRPTIQIVVRGSKYGFDEAYAKAKEIITSIDQKYNLTINSTRYISIHIMGGILDLGRDTNECPKISMNFVLEVASIYTEIYRNNFLTDPLGVFDISNSDYINPRVEYSYAAGYAPGIITDKGLVHTGSGPKTNLSLSVIDPSINLYVESKWIPSADDSLNEIQLRALSGLTNYMGVLLESLREAYAIRYLPNSELNEFVNSPTSNWVGKAYSLKMSLIGVESSVQIYDSLGAKIYDFVIDIDNLSNTDRFSLSLFQTSCQYLRVYSDNF